MPVDLYVGGIEHGTGNRNTFMIDHTVFCSVCFPSDPALVVCQVHHTLPTRPRLPLTQGTIPSASGTGNDYYVHVFCVVLASILYSGYGPREDVSTAVVWSVPEAEGEGGGKVQGGRD